VYYVAQELQSDTVKIKLDRWNVRAGKRLWEQIGTLISEPAESDAWMIYATQASLASEACMEELAYALKRALEKRTNEFPVIALFPSRVDASLIPASIGVRLHVSITDPDWKERIRAAVERRAPMITQPNIEPYFAAVHPPDPIGLNDGYKHVIELRPRAGVWSPFLVGIPAAEKDAVGFMVNIGAKDRLPGPPVMMLNFRHYEQAGWFCEGRNGEATPTRSLYVYCRSLPSVVLFGVDGGPPQFHVSLVSISASTRDSRRNKCDG
jgi:hypothetical protein